MHALNLHTMYKWIVSIDNRFVALASLFQIHLELICISFKVRLVGYLHLYCGVAIGTKKKQWNAGNGEVLRIHFIFHLINI